MYIWTILYIRYIPFRYIPFCSTPIPSSNLILVWMRRESRIVYLEIIIIEIVGYMAASITPPAL